MSSEKEFTANSADGRRSIVLKAGSPQAAVCSLLESGEEYLSGWTLKDIDSGDRFVCVDNDGSHILPLRIVKDIDSEPWEVCDIADIRNFIGRIPNGFDFGEYSRGDCPIMDGVWLRGFDEVGTLGLTKDPLYCFMRR